MLKRIGLIFLWLWIPATISTTFRYCGVTLGGIPTVFLYAPFIYLISRTIQGHFDRKTPVEPPTIADKEEPLSSIKDTHSNPSPFQSAPIVSKEGQLSTPANTLSEHSLSNSLPVTNEIICPSSERPHLMPDPISPHEKYDARIPLWAVISASTCIGILFVIICFLAVSNASLNDKVAQLSSDNQTLEQQLESAISRADTLSNSVDLLKKQRTALTDELTQQQVNSLYRDAELAFWESLAVIVTTSGNKYHSHGCYHLNDSNFFIFNVNLAESYGYTPCLDCNPPTPLR